MIIVLYLFLYLSFCDPILDLSSCDPFSVFSSVSDHRHNRPFPLHLPSCITLSQSHTPPANCHVLPRPFNIDFLVIEKVALSSLHYMPFKFTTLKSCCLENRFDLFVLQIISTFIFLLQSISTIIFLLQLIDDLLIIFT